MKEKNQEISMILKMLEEGKISSEEASKLIEALERSKENEYNEDESNMNDFDEFMLSMSDMAKSIGRVGARVGKEIMDSFYDIDFDLNEYQSKEYEYHVDPYAQIFIDTNGKTVLTKSHTKESQILLIVHVIKSDWNRIDDHVDINHESKKLDIRISKRYKRPVWLELRLPELPYESIEIKGKSGPIQCENIKGNQIRFNTSNGRILTKNMYVKEMHLESGNGRIVVENTSAELYKIRTTNGRIGLKHLTCNQTIDCETTNGKMEGFDLTTPQIHWSTINGRILLENSRSDDVSLSTTNGNVRIENVIPYEKNALTLNASTKNGGIQWLANNSMGMDFTADGGRHGNVIIDFDHIIHNDRYEGSRLTYVKGESHNCSKAARITTAHLSSALGTVRINRINE